jgi:lipoprotein-anchoring transpeptidase ErfK/SrfK
MSNRIAGRLVIAVSALSLLSAVPSVAATKATTKATTKAAAKAAPAAAAPVKQAGELNPCPKGAPTKVAAMKNGKWKATIKVYEKPEESEQPKWTLAIGDESHTRLVFQVFGEQNGWLNVAVPVRPNGSVGWIKASEVTVYESPYYVIVQIGRRQLTACRSGSVIQRERIGVGKGSTVTPVGSYYLLDLIKPKGGSGGAYGPFAFGLSGFSETIFKFAGCDGRLGIHGTNQPGALGTAVSSGCIRVSNTGITKLAKTLFLGTPVLIQP